MDEALGLVEFLSDLRKALTLSRERAVDEAMRRVAAGSDVLWLDIGDVQVTLDVMHEKTTSTKGSAGVEGKFWIVASAKAAATAGLDLSQSGTQTLVLTLTPQVQSITSDGEGRTVTQTTSLRVTGALAEGEQAAPAS